MRELGIWPAGRSATIDYKPLVPTSDLECGQSLTSSSSTSGVDAGRRMTSIAVNSTFINQCGDGCNAAAHCPGSETAISSPPFPGARQECRLSGGLGTCVSCGRIGEAPCTQIGSSCDTTLNPNCKNLPACQEGRPRAASAS